MARRKLLAQDRAKLIVAAGFAALAGLLAGASPAAAHHSFPATYTGTFTESGTGVTFTVWEDETIKEFAFAETPACGGTLGEGKMTGYDLIGEEHSFLLGPGDGTHLSGTFPDFREAEGTFRLQSPFGGQCILAWTATTTASLPPECHDDHDNDGDGRVDHPADPDCLHRNHSPERDMTPPNTIITSGPLEGATVGRGTSFQFSGTAGDTNGFFCQLDDEPFVACDSGFKSYFPLSDGRHTFRVKAVDAAGNEDRTPAVRTFHADGTPPDTAITGGPADGAHINDRSPAFTFEDIPSGDATRYSCYVNNVFSQCTSGATIAGAPLADGTYTFKVAAVDARSNQDQTPAQRTFTVDTTPPDTVIASAPVEGATTGDSPVFEFAADPAGDVDHFLCRSTDATFQPCESGAAVLGAPLADGPHQLAVIAVDRAGNMDPTPAERGFLVDATAPDTLITAGPAEGETVSTDSPVFGFAGNPAADTAGFACSIDDGPFQVCESGSPLPGSPLTGGQHKLAVRAIDAVGNADATVAQRTFRVDTTPRSRVQPPVVRPTGPPTISAAAKKRQRPVKQRGLIVTATCPEVACVLSASGVITRPAKKGSWLTLEGITKLTTAGRRVQLRLGLSRKAASKLRRALRQKRTAKKIRALIVLRATSQNGSATPMKLTISLQR